MTATNPHTPTTRLKQGKKIDTWRIDMPGQGDHILLDVHMIAKRQITFEVTSSHPLARDRTWRDSDLDRLYGTVVDDIEILVADHLDAEWERSLLVETHVGDKDHDSDGGMSLRLGFRSVHAARGAPDNNHGERRIAEKGATRTILERAFDDPPPDPTGFADMPLHQQMRYRANDTTSRVILKQTPETDRALADVSATLRAFTEILARRLGPADPAGGAPSPDELVDMMGQAAETVRKGDPGGTRS